MEEGRRGQRIVDFANESETILETYYKASTRFIFSFSTVSSGTSSPNCVTFVSYEMNFERSLSYLVEREREGISEIFCTVCHIDVEWV